MTFDGVARRHPDAGHRDVTRVTVPQRVADRLGRSSEAPFSLFPAPASLADGEVVCLQSHLLVTVGLAVVDRAAACFRLMAPGECTALDGAWADARLESARALRAAHGLTGPERAYRLLNGAGDRTPGVVADVFGPWAVVAALSGALVPTAQLLAQGMLDRRLARGVVVKHRARGQAAAGPAVVAVLGEAPPERLIVTEGPWRFEVHLTTGVNVGLFTDMRAERARIASLAAGRRVLNLFAYTGALSVAAASGGATHVTSVDLSEGVLAWARDHFALNGLDAAAHTTVATDVSTYLADAFRDGQRYDVVLIDPPSFSAARHAPFAIDRDYPPIIRDACALIAPGGDLWLASNTRGYSLAGAVQVAVPPARQPRLVAEGSLPPDYPTELSDADARYLQTALLRLV
ncbi:MAG: class I SAM-dependent rRNA methyltransferase [Acidobacteria bacterium]|nr:class I SAM-dependent rRNA methyltransferase [Acidobacteriota bacterium]